MKELILLLCVHLGSVLAQNCMDGWSNHGIKCYHLSRSDATWVEAMRMCEYHSGSLVRIETADEQAYINTLVGTSIDSQFWIGATDWAVGGQWKWEPTSVDLTFSNWRAGRPDNGNKEESCAFIDKHHHGQWDDADCTHKYSYICEARVQDGI